MNLPRLLTSLFFLATFAHAQTTTTLTPSVVSAYVFRGQVLGGAAFQPSVEIDSGNLAIGVWASTPIADKVAGVSDPEIDPYVTYTSTINDALSVAYGVTLYTYPRAEGYRHTVEPNLALTYSRWGFKVTPKAYYDTVLHAATGEVTLTRAIPLFTTELDLTAQGGQYRILDTERDALPRVKSWGDYYLVGFSVPFTLNKATKLSWGYAYTGGYVDSKQGKAPKDDSRAGRGVVSLVLSWNL